MPADHDHQSDDLRDELADDLPPEPEPGPDAVIGLGRVGALLGVSRQRVQRLLADGLLQGVKVGRQMQVVWNDASKMVRGAIDMARGQADDEHHDARGPLRLALDEVLSAFEPDEPESATLLREPLGSAVSDMLGLPALPDDDDAIGAALDRENDATLALRTVLALLRGAISCGASELHLEPGRHGVWVRQRRSRHTGLELVFDATTDIAIPLLDAAHKVLRLQRTQPASDSASLDVDAGGRSYTLRSAVFPTLHGPSITVRLQPSRERVARALDQLDLWPKQLQAIRSLLKAPRGGLVLIASDDAFAASAMRCAVLRELASPERKIVSLEYPVEADIDGVTQAVLPATRPAAALRDLAAHGAHVIACSDVPDADTAQQLMSRAEGGALVIAGLHAADTGDVLALMAALGVPIARVRAVLQGVIGVFPVRRLRPNAGIVDPAADTHREAFGLSADDVPLTAKTLPVDLAAAWDETPLLVADVIASPDVADNRLRTSLVHHLRHGHTTIDEALGLLRRSAAR